MTAANQDHYTELPENFIACPVQSAEILDKYLERNVTRNETPLTGKSIIVFSKIKPKDSSRKPSRKKKYITRQEKQKLNLLKCPKKGWDYAAFVGLRQMWKQYFRTYLELGDSPPAVESKEWQNFSLLLARADYHGAEMTVVRSKCPSMVGITGTCIIDSKNTFRLLSPDNKCRTIPKQDSVFTITLNNMELKIYGKYIMYKPADRSTRKIKSSIIPNL